MVDLQAEFLALIQAVRDETRHTQECLNAHGGPCICGVERQARFEAGYVPKGRAEMSERKVMCAVCAR